jgi:hypothetical protein
VRACLGASMKACEKVKRLVCLARSCQQTKQRVSMCAQRRGVNCADWSAQSLADPNNRRDKCARHRVSASISSGQQAATVLGRLRRCHRPAALDLNRSRTVLHTFLSVQLIRAVDPPSPPKLDFQRRKWEQHPPNEKSRT